MTPSNNWEGAPVNERAEMTPPVEQWVNEGLAQLSAPTAEQDYSLPPESLDGADRAGDEFASDVMSGVPVPEAVHGFVEKLKALVRRFSAWGGVETAVLKHHHKPDLQAVRVLFAAVASHYLEGAPVWPMLVAPPGSMKTEVLEGMRGLTGVHPLDSLSPKTFISGQVQSAEGDGPSPSLLHRIGPNGIIYYPDFSTILAMGYADRGTILADMRRIYDGHLEKEFGTSQGLDKRSWQGRITFVVAVTPAIDGYYGVFQTLGERFVMVRWPRAGGVETGLTAINQDRTEAKGDIQRAVHKLIKKVRAYKIEPTIPEDMQVRLVAMSEIAVRARTHIPRTGYNKEMTYVPEPESNTRLAQQLAQLAKGSALVDGRTAVNDADFEMVRRCAFDCMPPARKLLLEALMRRHTVDSVRMPQSTRTYALQELEAQNLIEGTGKDAQLSPLSIDMLTLAKLYH